MKKTEAQKLTLTSYLVELNFKSSTSPSIYTVSLQYIVIHNSPKLSTSVKAVYQEKHF